jgi:predicted secreted Zn-dependent protease
MLGGDDRLEWRRSTRCANGNCLWVAVAGDLVHVRDEADRRIAISRRAWELFIEGIRAGDFVEDTILQAGTDSAR